MKFTVVFILLWCWWLIVSGTREVALECGVPVGIPGLKGEPGMKGERGENDQTLQNVASLEERISELETLFEIKLRELTHIQVHSNTSNCDELYNNGIALDGFYNIILNERVVEIYCEFQKNNRNWLVFQRRNSGVVDFDLDWQAYARGFGRKDSEFWWGLDNLHEITNTASYTLRIELEDWVGNKAFAQYGIFSVESSTTDYRLNVASYTGTAGNSLAWHYKQPFSIKDKDNDPSGINCAVSRHGAWWHRSCGSSNLNGKYVHGLKTNHRGSGWYNWKNNAYSLKKSEMKIALNKQLALHKPDKYLEKNIRSSLQLP